MYHSIWDTLNSIHSSEEIKPLIPIETIATQPFPYRNETGSYVLGLLCLQQGNSAEAGFYPLCGCPVWEYPGMKFIKWIDLKDFRQGQEIYLAQSAMATQNYCDEMETALRENTPVPLPDKGLLNLYNEITEKHMGARTAKAAPQAAPPVTPPESRPAADPEKSGEELLKLMSQAKQLLIDFKMDFLMDEWKNIYGKIHGFGFTVAVVGEFSRGKSTLVNKILGGEILPVSNLPTTAMLTKVLYGSSPGIEHVFPDGKKDCLPLESASWEKLVVDLFGDGPEGVVRVEIPDGWLKKNEIQIIDTPGAGDLSDKRIDTVSDAIIGCDGVLIAVNATMALSLTEKAFIEQHVISKQVPHIMVVLTKLDQVAAKERTSVIDYVRDKLSVWGGSIPVYIPQDASILDSPEYEAFAGIDKIKGAIEEWTGHSSHIELKNKSLCIHLQGLLNMVRSALAEEKKALKLSDEEKNKAMKEQKLKVEKLDLLWEEYRLQMLKRSNTCGEWLRKSADAKKESITERLQFELTHTGNPKVWWTNDLPYRLKQEMSGVARGMTDGFNQIFARDLKWLNDSMSKQFSSGVPVNSSGLSVNGSFDESSLLIDNISDTGKMRMFMRIGAGVGTILGYVLFGPFGTAVSIGGAIASEILMGKNIEKQKETLKGLVAEVVDKTLDRATETCEKRIQEIYDRAVEESEKQEKIWLAAQNEAIARAGKPDEGRDHSLALKLETVQRLIDKTNVYLGV